MDSDVVWSPSDGKDDVWDDTLILAAFDKAVRGHRTRGESKRRKRRGNRHHATEPSADERNGALPKDKAYRQYRDAAAAAAQQDAAARQSAAASGTSAAAGAGAGSKARGRGRARGATSSAAGDGQWMTVDFSGSATVEEEQQQLGHASGAQAQSGGQPGLVYGRPQAHSGTQHVQGAAQHCAQQPVGDGDTAHVAYWQRLQRARSWVLSPPSNATAATAAAATPVSHAAGAGGGVPAAQVYGGSAAPAGVGSVPVGAHAHAGAYPPHPPLPGVGMPHGGMPMPPMPVPGLPSHGALDGDDSLPALLMAWYYAGYYTGRHQAKAEMAAASAVRPAPR